MGMRSGEDIEGAATFLMLLTACITQSKQLFLVNQIIVHTYIMIPKKTIGLLSYTSW